MDSKQELIAIIIMTLGVLLWPLGGYRWKGWRRFVLPGCLLPLLVLYGVSVWQSLLSCGFLMLVSLLGYGQSTPWLIPFRDSGGKIRSSKLLTALLYNLPALVLGWTWWMLITPAIFLITFYLSNTKAFGKDFSWKICEGITGLTVAVTIISALQRSW